MLAFRGNNGHQCSPMFHRTAILAFFAISCAWASTLANAADERRDKVLKDKPEVEAIGHWIYNDLPKALTEAARTRKPMLVVFRCIP